MGKVWTEGQPQVCIFIRGYPGVGKTTLARALGRELRFAVLLKDDVRAPSAAFDAILRKELIARGVSKEIAGLVDSNAACYRVLNLIMKTQLHAFARGVIVESPLGRENIAREAVQEAKSTGALCVLVDCVLDRNEWAKRLSNRSHTCGTVSADESIVGVDAHASDVHAIAHAAIKHDPDSIESMYPDGLRFDVDGMSAEIEVDCAKSVDECVQIVSQVVEKLPGLSLLK